MLHQRVKSQLNRYPRIEHHDLPARPQHRIASLSLEEGPYGFLAGVADHFAFAEHAGGRGGGWGGHSDVSIVWEDYKRQLYCEDGSL
jgi:hypothetical protein